MTPNGIIFRNELLALFRNHEVSDQSNKYLDVVVVLSDRQNSILTEYICMAERYEINTDNNVLGFFETTMKKLSDGWKESIDRKEVEHLADTVYRGATTIEGSATASAFFKVMEEKLWFMSSVEASLTESSFWTEAIAIPDLVKLLVSVYNSGCKTVEDATSQLVGDPAAKVAMQQYMAELKGRNNVSGRIHAVLNKHVI